jgi:hypothetical protein
MKRMLKAADMESAYRKPAWLTSIEESVLLAD